MRRIGILGGSFNPIHPGHLLIAKESYRQLNLDEIWIMPSGNPPHKRKEDLAPDELRKEMILAQIKEEPYMKLCTYEMDKEETSYTAWTLMDLSAQYPKDQFYYIVGSDSLCYMENWYEAETIFDMAHIVAGYRSTESQTKLLSHAEYLRRAFGAKVTLVHNDAVDVSSSMIRKACKEHQPIDRYVHPDVCKIIMENHLYQ